MSNHTKTNKLRTSSVRKTTNGKTIVRVYVERPGCIEDSYEVYFDDFGGVETYPAYRSCYGNTSGSPDKLDRHSELYRAVVRAADDKVRVTEG